jgi:hypothetical protein
VSDERLPHAMRVITHDGQQCYLPQQPNRERAAHEAARLFLEGFADGAGVHRDVCAVWIEPVQA